MKNGYVVSDHVFMIMHISVINAYEELLVTFEGPFSYLEIAMKFLFLMIHFFISVSLCRNSKSHTRNGASINLSKRYHIVCNIGPVHKKKSIQSKIINEKIQ